MTASKLLLVALFGAVGYLLLKNSGLHLSPMVAGPQSPTVARTGGTQSVANKSDFQTVADDVTSLFASASSIFGGGKAQTDPETL